MITALNDGTGPEMLSVRVYNSDTVVLAYGTPVYLNFVPNTVGTRDGVSVARYTVATGAGVGFYVGPVSNPRGINPNEYGDIWVYGLMPSVPVICNTRATLVTAYGTQAAVAAGLGVTIDTTNNLFTALTTITKTQSNIVPALLVDGIAANQGNGTTPATNLYYTVKTRVFIPFF